MTFSWGGGDIHWGSRQSQTDMRRKITLAWLDRCARGMLCTSSVLRPYECEFESGCGQFLTSCARGPQGFHVNASAQRMGREAERGSLPCIWPWSVCKTNDPFISSCRYGESRTLSPARPDRKEHSITSYRGRASQNHGLPPPTYMSLSEL